jgi:hypothetical protein
MLGASRCNPYVRRPVCCVKQGSSDHFAVTGIRLHAMISRKKQSIKGQTRHPGPQNLCPIVFEGGLYALIGPRLIYALMVSQTGSAAQSIPVMFDHCIVDSPTLGLRQITRKTLRHLILKVTLDPTTLAFLFISHNEQDCIRNAQSPSGLSARSQTPPH